MDEERMNHYRQMILRENARFVNTNTPSENKSNNSNRKFPNKKIIRCKYCYCTGHTDSKYPDKERKRPPSMLKWISKATCQKCKKKGHLAVNCPPKYLCKTIKPLQRKTKILELLLTMSLIQLTTQLNLQVLLVWLTHLHHN